MDRELIVVVIGIVLVLGMLMATTLIAAHMKMSILSKLSETQALREGCSCVCERSH